MLLRHWDASPGDKNDWPYGDDVEDLGVMTFIKSEWETSYEVLETDYPKTTARLVDHVMLSPSHRHDSKSSFEPKSKLTW